MLPLRTREIQQIPPSLYADFLDTEIRERTAQISLATALLYFTS